MRSWSLVVVLVACVWVRDATAKDPPGSPPELIATLAIGTNLDPLRAYVDAVRPGMSMTFSDAMLRGELASSIHATSLDALDPSAGTFIFLVAIGDAFDQVVAGKVRDATQLAKDTASAHLVTHGAWAVIGSEAATKIIAPYAFAALPGRPLPSSMVIELEVPRLVAKFQPMIAGAQERAKQMFANESQGTSQILGSIVDGAFGMLDEVDRAVVTLDSTRDILAFDVAVAAKPRTRLAKFIGVQHPSDLSLLDKLPDLPAAMVVAGRFDAGPYRAGVIEVLGSMYSFGSTDKVVKMAFDAIMKAATGEVAMVTTTAPQASAQVFAVDDPKHIDQAVETLAKALVTPRSFEFRGMTMTIQTKSKPERHGDAKFAQFSLNYDTSNATAQMRKALAQVASKDNDEEVGTVGKLGIVTMNVEPALAADAIHGTGKTLVLEAAFSAQLAAARARKDSVAGLVDLGLARKASVVLPMYMSMGYADGRAHVRFGLPATTLRNLTK